jgi:putative intracellular protease/amidase
LGALTVGLTGLQVGVYASGGAPYHHAAFAALHGADVHLVRAEDVHAGRLDGLDVFIMPGGGKAAMHGMLAPLGVEGAAAVRRFVEEGGTYLSSCAGSFLPLAVDAEVVELYPAMQALRMTDLRPANEGPPVVGGLASPGVGRIRVRLAQGSPFTDELAGEVELVHYNGPLFVGDKEAQPFAWPVAATEAFTPAEGFMGPDSEAATLAGCIAQGASTGVIRPVGDGQAILFGSHPEFGLGPLQLGWDDGSILLLNALKQVPKRGHSVAGPGGPMTVERGHPDLTLDGLHTRVDDSLSRVAAAFERLASTPPAAWLEAGTAPGFHGLGAPALWERDVEAAGRLAGFTREAYAAVAFELTAEDTGWLDDEPRNNQDVGGMGLVQLLDRANADLAEAERLRDAPPSEPAHAYDALDRHPFHLTVGTYLSAGGLLAAAALVVAMLNDRHDRHAGSLHNALFDPQALTMEAT